ncbi:MAG: hypothetical protein MR717_09245 [Prevotella sp.]|nr:hypothetical protein [Prevotella sp.]
MYWWNNSGQVILSRLEGGQCLLGCMLSDKSTVISDYDICDCDMFANEILGVGAPSVRIITYRNPNGTLTVPDMKKLLDDKKADFTRKKSKKWNRKHKRVSRG